MNTSVATEIETFAEIVDIPLWALLDPNNPTRSTVKARRHLISRLTSRPDITIKYVADLFGFDRSTIWRARIKHCDATRHAGYATECGQVDKQIGARLAAITETCR